MATKNKDNEVYENKKNTTNKSVTDKNFIDEKNLVIRHDNINLENSAKQPQTSISKDNNVKIKKNAQNIEDVLIFSEEVVTTKKPSFINQFLEYRKRNLESNKETNASVDTNTFNDQLRTADNLLTCTPNKKLDFLDESGFYISRYRDVSAPDNSLRGYSGYEADIEDNPESMFLSKTWNYIEPPVLFCSYDLLIKKKKRFLYNNIIAVSTNFLFLNYINYLFYRHSWMLMYPDSIKFKLAARKHIFKLNKYKNSVYYSRRVYFDISGSRAVVQLTSRYRNKFFTFLRKNLHFNLSVGRVSFWKLKKTVYSRVLNFYNVFFRCIIPFLSRRFTILLYKLLRDWSGDLQKFNGAVLRAKRKRKIRRAYSIFKVVIFPKIIYGFMRSSKYPVRKRFLQRRAFIKYVCF